MSLLKTGLLKVKNFRVFYIQGVEGNRFSAVSAESFPNLPLTQNDDFIRLAQLLTASNSTAYDGREIEKLSRALAVIYKMDPFEVNNQARASVQPNSEETLPEPVVSQELETPRTALERIWDMSHEEYLLVLELYETLGSGNTALAPENQQRAFRFVQSIGLIYKNNETIKGWEAHERLLGKESVQTTTLKAANQKYVTEYETTSGKSFDQVFNRLTTYINNPQNILQIRKPESRTNEIEKLGYYLFS
jgi:hypothetical protein